MATELDTDLIGRIWQGDCLDWLGMLPDNSAHCCITSIPYWGLRDYQTPPVVWGGDAECEHEWRDERIKEGPKKWDTSTGQRYPVQTTELTVSQGKFCSLCGAWRGDLGLEPTPELYVEHVVMIFREVRRVLRHDAVLWLNIGDSYAASGGAHKPDHANPGISKSADRSGVPHFGERGEPGHYLAPPGLKPKDLCGIPWRVAFALQADGWWLRSDVIWSKPNPMPESVTDRPTRSHEYVFLFTKSARYWYDADAVREPPTVLSDWPGSWKRARLASPTEKRTEGFVGETNPSAGRNLRSVWTIATEAMGWEMCTACKRVYDAAQYRRLPQVLWLRVLGAEGDLLNELRVEAVGPIEMLGRNTVRAECECGEGVAVCRTGEEALPCTACDLQYQLVAKGICSCGRDDSWLSHFATFPTKLVARCLEAGCPHKVCAECGAPWVREVERSRSFESGSGRSGRDPVGKHGPGLQGGGETRDVRRGPVVTTTSLGFLPTCSCGGETEPGLLIDPFAGSGTALVMAERLGRRHAGCDLNSDYVKMAEKRIGREREQKQLALEH